MPVSSKYPFNNVAQVLDAIPVPVFIKDSQSRFVGMNKACEEHWGISFQTIEMTDGSDFFPAEQMVGFLEKDQEIFRTRTAIDFEERVWNHKLQQNRISHTFKCPTYDSAGNPELLVCILMDITGEKGAMDSLRHSEEKLRTLYELAPLGIALTSMSGKYLEFNDAFRRICGYSQEELSDLDYWKLTPQEYAAQEAKQLELISLTGRYGPYEKEYIQKSGARIPLRLNGVLVTGANGEPHIWSIVEDISERKNTEERLRQSQKLEAVGQLTAGIAHDFNNLLSIILGNVELIAADKTISDTARDMAARAISAIERGGELTQQLLSFSRRQALLPATIDLGAEVRRITSMVARVIPETIALDVAIDPERIPVRVDRNQLGNALINLAVNARDAIKGAGTIAISVTLQNRSETQTDGEILSAGRYGVIAVQDNGGGMSPEVLAKAFDPFFTTKETGVGSGLGLSMVYGFMRQSNGQAQLSSVVGQGTVVELLFPVVAWDVDETPTPGVDADAPMVKQNRKVLLVEDMPDVRATILEQLVSLGLAVTAAANSKEALATLEGSGPFDLLLTDIGLPGNMSGAELARIVAERHPATRVLLMSGYNSPQTTSAATPQEWNLLHKPFRRSELAEKINVLFGKS